MSEPITTALGTASAKIGVLNESTIVLDGNASALLTICASSVATLREFICLGGGGGDVFINSEIVLIDNEPLIMVNDVSDNVIITEDDGIMVSEISDLVQITEIKEGVIDELY